MIGNASLEKSAPVTVPIHRVGTRPLRLAVLPDFRAEGWPSMDLCAEMLLERLATGRQRGMDVERVCPEFRRHLGNVPGMGNVDRFLNRHWIYPRHVRGRRVEFDLFHICDHSYAQLALELPAQRTGVFCHDLDTFRCLLEPALEPRPFWFCWMMRRVLRGFQRAALVFHTTLAVRAAILRHRLAPADRLVHAPLGHAEEFRVDPQPDCDASRILGALAGRPFLLHVGSCIPRKRVDFLLDLFAQLRIDWPGLRLVKVGGSWTAAQSDIIRRHEMRTALTHVADISRRTLAVLYRHAALVLLPSDAEGFGLPIVEALACGAPVLASDLPVLREVGGATAEYAPVGALSAWRDRVMRMLHEPQLEEWRNGRAAQARRFSWDEHARIIADAYRRLAV